MYYTIILQLLDSIVPVFTLIFLGIALRAGNVIGDVANDGIQKYVYNCAMPTLLFTYIIQYPPHTILNTQYIMLTGILFLIIFGSTMLISGLYFKQSDKSTLLQAVTTSYPNAAYMGLPICYFAFGEKGLVPAVIYVVFLSIFLSLSALIIPILDMRKQQHKNYVALAGKLLSIPIKNPFLYSFLLAILWLKSTLGMPKMLSSSLEMVANTTAPLALISIGVSLYFIAKNKGDKTPHGEKHIGFTVIVKLLVTPCIAWLLVTPFPMDPIWKAVFVIQSAMPSGIITYIMCKQQNIFVQRGSFAILLTTALSTVSLPLMLSFFL